jgi:hypothetical protein
MSTNGSKSVQCFGKKKTGEPPSSPAMLFSSLDIHMPRGQDEGMMLIDGRVV